MNDTLKLLDEFQDKLLALIQSEQNRLGTITEDHLLYKDDVFNALTLELLSLQQSANYSYQDRRFYHSYKWGGRLQMPPCSLDSWRDEARQTI
ncbi:hypothetical protein OAE74_00005 [Verrucomicrobia bacterium]|nr:hypothetical protein [Verrucomicrobiota bacterium]